MITLDHRCTGVYANDSGCLGAALSNRWLGENLYTIRQNYPFWFTHTFQNLSLRDLNKKVDQHFLLALIAPRQLYIGSAHRDIWADPIGEFLGLKYALPTYQLFNADIPGLDLMAPLNHPIHQYVGYHVRPGVHDLKPISWEFLLTYLNQYKLKYQKITR